MKYLKTFENFKPIKNNLEKPFKIKKDIDRSILHLQKSIKGLRRRIPSENDIKKRTKITLDANKKVRDLAELQLKKFKQNIYLNEHPIDESNKQQETDNININNNFRKWFSDSKIVDNSGNPLVLYHGSHEFFEEFMG
jgi:hypothetical protein